MRPPTQLTTLLCVTSLKLERAHLLSEQRPKRRDQHPDCKQWHGSVLQVRRVFVQPPDPEAEPRKNEHSVVHKEHGNRRHVARLDSKSHPVHLTHVRRAPILGLLLGDARHVPSLVRNMATLVHPDR